MRKEFQHLALNRLVLGRCLEDRRGKELEETFLQLFVTLGNSYAKKHPLKQLCIGNNENMYETGTFKVNITDNQSQFNDLDQDHIKITHWIIKIRMRESDTDAV